MAGLWFFYRGLIFLCIPLKDGEEFLKNLIVTGCPIDSIKYVNYVTVIKVLLSHVGWDRRALVTNYSYFTYTEYPYTQW